ncbi:DUF268 domain-containing protein [Halobacteriovorax marinus]|uniref:DUF268 domain-containing protein n=1 Tax=Halobacteriovorax marinus TaxID=97084 RepID=UPI003A8E55D6
MLVKTLKLIIQRLNVVGVDPIQIVGFTRGIPRFLLDYIKIRKEVSVRDFPVRFFPILHDKYKEGGTASGHYFHQDLVVARKVYESSPLDHLDVGSRIDGFVAHLAVFRKVIVVDIRDLDSKVKNIEFIQADMINMKRQMEEKYVSISCLHALEHFGLGRYGDPIDSCGHLKGFDNMFRALKVGGTLYLSVPIGEQRLEFNAHRVFSLRYLLDMFEGKFELVDFSYVDDSGDLVESVVITEEMVSSNCGCWCGCGIFELVKI